MPIFILLAQLALYQGYIISSADINSFGVSPEQRESSAMAYSPIENSIIIFGGNSQYYYNDLWTFNLSSLKWSIIYPVSYIPVARSSAAGFFRVKSSEFCIYGGQNANQIFTDLNCLSFQFVNWKIISTNLDPPSLRSFSFSYFTHSDEEYLAIVGTTFMNYNLMLFLLRFDTLEWKYVDLNFTYQSTETSRIIPKYVNPLVSHLKGQVIVQVLTNYPSLQYTLVYELDNDSVTISTYETNFSPYEVAGYFIGDFYYIFFSNGILSKASVFPLTSTQTWTLSAKSRKQNTSTVHYNSSIFQFGGTNMSYGNEVYTNNIIRYEIVSNNLIETELVPDCKVPPPRFGHSLNLIRGILYLFGGKSSTSYLSDMWTYDPSQKVWTDMTLNNSPSPRAFFASDVQGDALIIWGGEDANGFNNDLFMYNAMTNQWTAIITNSDQVPSKRKASCIALELPFAYIIGGIDEQGLCIDSWIFNFGNNTYTFLSDIIQLAYTHCTVQDGQINLYGGLSSVLPLIYPMRRLDDVDITMAYQADSVIGTSFVGINGGGVRFGGFDQINDVLVGKLRVLLNFTGFSFNFYDFTFFSASCYYGHLIYFFGGVYYADMYTPLNNMPKPRFSTINLFEICQVGKCPMLCGLGFYQANNTCVICPSGSYADQAGSLECTLCPSGYYNPAPGASDSRQCYPCAQGTFNDKEGARFCKLCSSSQYCPTGSKEPAKFSQNMILNNSFQPPIYQNTSPSKNLLFIEYATGFATAFIIIIALLVPKLRNLTSKLDFYSGSHSFEDGEFVQIKRTLIGGIFTIFFIGVALFMLTSVLLIFFNDNVIESKSLMPLMVLENNLPVFSSDFQLELQLKNYGDQCVGATAFSVTDVPQCSSGIKFSLSSVGGNQDEFSCMKDMNNTCIVTYKCFGCQVEINSYLKFEFQEPLSYATSLLANITSSSSIPNYPSTAFAQIFPQLGYIFIGPEPSIFEFSMTPSYFSSTLPQFPAEETGYHVTLESSPVEGSQNLIENLSITAQLSVIVYLQKQLLGLYTSRDAKQNSLLLLSSLFGTITGIFGVIGSVMGKAEGLLKKNLKKAVKINKLKAIVQKSIQISDTHFDFNIQKEEQKVEIVERSAEFTNFTNNAPRSNAEELVKINCWINE